MNNDSTAEFLAEVAQVWADRNSTPEAIEAMEADIAPSEEGDTEALICEAGCRCEYCNPRANYP